MNYLDIAILVILAGFTLKGLLRGLLKEVCSLVGLVAGSFLAFRYHNPLAQWLMDTLNLPSQLCVVAAFLLLFLVTVILFSALGFLLSRVVKLIFLGGFNRVAGGLFGLMQGVVLLAVVLFALSLGPLPGSVRDGLVASRLAPPFVDLGRTVFTGSNDLLQRRA